MMVAHFQQKIVALVHLIFHPDAELIDAVQLRIHAGNIEELGLPPSAYLCARPGGRLSLFAFGWDLVECHCLCRVQRAELFFGIKYSGKLLVFENPLARLVFRQSKFILEN